MPADLPQAPPGPKPKPAEKSQAQKLLDKLGLSRPIDLALHLPLRSAGGCWAISSGGR